MRGSSNSMRQQPPISFSERQNKRGNFNSIYGQSSQKPKIVPKQNIQQNSLDLQYNQARWSASRQAHQQYQIGISSLQNSMQGGRIVTSSGNSPSPLRQPRQHHQSIQSNTNQHQQTGQGYMNQSSSLSKSAAKIRNANATRSPAQTFNYQNMPRQIQPNYRSTLSQSKHQYNKEPIETRSFTKHMQSSLVDKDFYNKQQATIETSGQNDNEYPAVELQADALLTRSDLEEGDTLSDPEFKRPSVLLTKLEQSISSLHSRQKTLEGTYIDLANFYKQSLLKYQKSSNTSRDGSLTKKKQAAINLDQEKYIIDIVKQEKKQLEWQFQSLYQLQKQMVQKEQAQPSIQSDQPGRNLQLKTDLNIGDADFEHKLNEFEIQQQYAVQNMKESIFQLQNSNEKAQLDLKKIEMSMKGLVQYTKQFENSKAMDTYIDSLNRGCQDAKSRHQQTISQISNLEKSQSDFNLAINGIKDHFKLALNQEKSSNFKIDSDQNEQLQKDLHHLRKQNKKLEDKRVSDTKEIEQLQEQNHALQGQLQYADMKSVSQDVFNKAKLEIQMLNTEKGSLQSNVLLKEETINQLQMEVQRLKKMNYDMQTSQPRQQMNTNDQQQWYHSCQDLTALVTRFLQAMRKLQKAVHKKDKSVAEEKNVFELAKKELETYLKSIQKKLINSSEMYQNPQQIQYKHTQSVYVPPTSNYDLKRHSGSTQSQRELNYLSSGKDEQPIVERIISPSQSARFNNQTGTGRWNSMLNSQQTSEQNLQENKRQKQLLSTDEVPPSMTSPRVMQPTSDLQQVAFENMQRENSELNNLNQKLRAELTKSDRQLIELNSNSEMLSRKFEREKTRYEMTISGLKNENDQLSKEIVKLQQNILNMNPQSSYEETLLKQQLNHQQSQESNNEVIQMLRDDIKELEKANKDLKKQIQQQEEASQLSKLQIDDLKKTVQAKNNAIENLKHQQELKESMANAQNDKNQQLANKIQIEQLSDQIFKVESEQMTQMKQLERDLEVKESQLNNLTDRVRKAKDDQQKQIYRQQAQISQDRQKYESQIEEMDRQLVMYKEQIAKLETAQLKDKLKRKNLKQDLNMKDQYVQLHSQSKQEVQDLQNELNMIRQELEELQFKEEGYKKEIKGLIGAKTDLQNDLEFKEQEQQETAQQLENLKQEYVELQKRFQLYQDTEEKLFLSEEQQKRLQSQLDSVQQKLHKTETQLKREALEKNKLQQTVDVQIQQLKDRAILIHSQKEQLEELENYKREVEDLQGALQDATEQAQAHEQRCKQLINERDQAQEQLSHIINQNKFEKNSLEEKLQAQLNETMNQLNAREDDCERLTHQVEQLSLEKNALSREQLQITKQLKQAENELIQVQQANELAVQQMEQDLNKTFAKKQAEVVAHMTKESQMKEDQITDLQRQLQALQSDYNQTLKQMQAQEAANQEANQNSFSQGQELQNANIKVDELEQELRNQSDNFTKKIQNYKDKLVEKQNHINKLEKENRELYQKAQDLAAINDQSVHSVDNMQTENVKLAQKLQTMELELAKAREMGKAAQIEKLKLQKQKDSEQTDRDDDKEAIKDLEDHLDLLKKQLHQAKDDIIQQVDKKYAAKIKYMREAFADEYILQKHIREEKNSDVDWNNLVKECARIRFNSKVFLLIQRVDNGEYVVVDEANLPESTLLYLRSFCGDLSAPDDGEDDDFDNHSLSQKDNKDMLENVDLVFEMQKLKIMIQDLKSDRLELVNELNSFKDKLYGNNQKRSILQLKHEELQEDNDFLTCENKEMAVKVKEVCIANAELKLRVFELNQMVGTNDSNERGNRLADELNEGDFESVIRNEMGIIEAASNEEDIDCHDFSKDLQINQQHSHRSGRSNSRMSGSNKHDFLSDNESITDAVMQMTEPNHSNDQQLLSARKKIEKLEQQLLEAQSKITSLTDELKRAQDVNQELNEDDKETLSHVKGTLIQFLRVVPILDNKTEQLLTIIYSMMEFTGAEINEVSRTRQEIKQDKKKRGTSQAPSSKSNNSFGSNNNQQSNANFNQEDANKALRKGIFGFMKKNKDNVNNSANMAPQPIRSTSQKR